MPWPWSNKKVFGLLLLAVVAALFLLLPIRGSNLATGTVGWTSQGCFVRGGVYAATFFDSQISAHERQGATLWGSHCGNDASTGELRSAPFAAPTILELFVAGYVGGAERPGLKLFLEREDNHARVTMRLRREPGEMWVKLRWWMDADVRGKKVRLVAIDNETGPGGWMGVSNPRSLSVLNYWRQELKSWSQTMGTYLFQLGLFLLPGLALASVLTARKESQPLAAIYLVMVVICTGATLGYVSFWLFFFSRGWGQGFSYVVYFVAAGVLVLQAIRSTAAIKTSFALIREPFLYATLAGLCYTSFYFLFSDPFFPGIGYASDRFFVDVLAADNVIPMIFAERIYDRKPVKPFCCGDWLSSDRPPLQTGIVLMERPLSVMKNAETRYELLSSALQCFWICGVWCLLTAIGTERRRIRQVLGFLIFSGFLFYNSVYTWPKLLAASCILFLLSILFDIGRAKRALSSFEAVLAAVCLGLALMAHPGSTFSLAVFAVLFVKLRKLFALRQLALSLLIVIAFYLPWSGYQKYVDPPGNRLLKMHLGGVIPVDARSTWETIRDSYHLHPWREIVWYKWSNLVFLGGKDFFDSYGLTARDGAAREKSRNAQRVYMWNAVGLVNAGWLAWLVLLMRRRQAGRAIPYADWLIAAALANLVFWSLITFGPYETQTAHSSYADILLLSIGLLSFVLTLPRVVFGVLFAWQLFNFFAVWVWSLPARIAQPISFEWPMVITGGIVTLVLVWMTLSPVEEAPVR